MATVSKFAVRSVAGLRGVRAEVRAEAEKIASRAAALFSPHDHPGGAKITTSKGTKTDYFANLEDEDEAAGAIEFGGVRKDGRVVEGLHIMRRAAGT